VKGFGSAKPIQQESDSGYLILIPKEIFENKIPA